MAPPRPIVVPRSKRCARLDAVLIDLQDAGVRFYTYETVVRYFLEAAGQTGTDIVVLDRPNPLDRCVRAGSTLRSLGAKATST